MLASVLDFFRFPFVDLHLKNVASLHFCLFLFPFHVAISTKGLMNQNTLVLVVLHRLRLCDSALKAQRFVGVLSRLVHVALHLENVSLAEELLNTTVQYF